MVNELRLLHASIVSWLPLLYSGVNDVELVTLPSETEWPFEDLVHQLRYRALSSFLACVRLV
ncbi:hypothetical protein J2Z65_001447 [Paenibacillus aceris]|uniref:Uncharacterized protein n=1 Tax=Paenibacillus aceris TaxID=869555 RepID=A0ABS4HUE7_9BACL|nr:hypothetical protein [Paenibacillus aceris]